MNLHTFTSPCSFHICHTLEYYERNVPMERIQFRFWWCRAVVFSLTALALSLLSCSHSCQYLLYTSNLLHTINMKRYKYRLSLFCPKCYRYVENMCTSNICVSSQHCLPTVYLLFPHKIPFFCLFIFSLSLICLHIPLLWDLIMVNVSYLVVNLLTREEKKVLGHSPHTVVFPKTIVKNSKN